MGIHDVRVVLSTWGSRGDVEPLAGLAVRLREFGALWEQDAQRVNAMYADALNRHRAALGLPPVDNVRDHVLTDRALLAADPVLCPWQDKTELDLVQTGAWILPDERPLPGELE